MAHQSLFLTETQNYRRGGGKNCNFPTDGLGEPRSGKVEWVEERREKREAWKFLALQP
jgi:hypothetical protein